MRTTMALLLGSIVSIQGNPVQATEMWFYCGSYTTKLGHVDGRGESIGIYTLDSETGAIQKRGSSPPIVNSSHLCPGRDGRFLYSISEIYEYEGRRDGCLTVYSVDPRTKALSHVQMVSSHGPGPAYVSLDRSGRYLLLANYVAGKVVVYPIQSDGRLAAPSADVQHTGSSVNRDRQQEPHPHSIVASPDNRFVFVPDLGTDQIVAYEFDVATGGLKLAPRRNVATPPGSGPRHMAFSPSGRWAFLSLELSSEVMALAYDDGQLQVTGRYSTLPSEFVDPNACAEIRIAPDERHAYVSNRGHDSLAAFRVDAASGTLQRTQIISTAGKVPRNFGNSSDGKWIVAANQDSHSLVSFRRDASTGNLHEVDSVESPSPAVISFIEPL